MDATKLQSLEQGIDRKEVSKFTFQLQSTMFDAIPKEAKQFAQKSANYHHKALTMLVLLGGKWLKYKTFNPTM